MKKPPIVLWAVSAVGVAGAALTGFLTLTTGEGDPAVVNRHGRPADVKSLSVRIGDRTFTMSNGSASIAAAPGSNRASTVRIVGEPVWGDVDRDGLPDAALLLENDAGGGGAFYYAVLAVDGADGYRSTNALLLGDRIAPQTVDFLDGHFVYNYQSRRPGEPMTALPSVQESLWIRFDNASGAISPGS